MKRYVRTKDGKVYDTVKNYESCDTILLKDVAVESDKILDLIQVGDFIFFRSKENNEIYQVIIDTSGHLVSLISNIYVDKTIEVTKLYTEQGDNYILVWDEDRGVI